MPITSKVDKSKNLTIYTLTGVVTIDEIEEALKSFWEAKELTLNLMWDARSANVTNLKSSDIERVVMYISKYRNRFEERKDGKAAIVAPKDLQYGLSRMIETLYEIREFPTELKPFREIEDAIHWFGSG